MKKGRRDEKGGERRKRWEEGEEGTGKGRGGRM